MRVIQNFHANPNEQRFTVPDGVTSCLLEAWGAAGGLGSNVAWAGKANVLVGGSAQTNQHFTNRPTDDPQIGFSFANGAGYAAGTLATTPGEAIYVNVGGNGGPGYSAVKTLANGTHAVSTRGGFGGYNGGGPGGKGAAVYQNLYNAPVTTVKFNQAGVPNGSPAVAVGDLWLDTTNHLVRRCTTAYNTTTPAGHGTLALWTTKTDTHTFAVGPSGGGGGGATDFRRNGNGLGNRILVAGGGGGTGGSWNKTTGAPSGWKLVAGVTSPNPPFGTDTTSSGPTDKINHVWCTQTSYLTGGWGLGGLGGSTSPTNGGAPTTTGGLASAGGAGGPATGRHATAAGAVAASGSAGIGGTNLAGGTKGAGGTGSTAGAVYQGGTGADAAGGFDDFCAGGGGGGGGFYGGGGGGHGFLNYGASAATGATSHGGGGGGGSNYADPVLTNISLNGCTRPPSPAPGFSAANGVGGFARITYRLLPGVQWTSIPTSVLGGAAYAATFQFSPAVANGTGIAYYVVGTSNTITDVTPTTTTTITVTDVTQTSFTRTFTAPVSGSSQAVFVKVVDKDGDSSGWLKQIVSGVASGVSSPATITAPTGGSTFSNSATVNWTVGTQTPEVAYKLAMTGLDVNTGNFTTLFVSGWRRAGSRVNLATDPGFTATTNVVWSSGFNANLVGNDASFAGVSGKNGKISWTAATDLSAENHTTKFNNLIVGSQYRMHIGLASALANDTRQFQVMVWDDTGPLNSTFVDVSPNAAGTYTVIDLPFYPQAQGVFVQIIPSSTGTGNFGDADASQITYVKDFLIELTTEEDAVSGYPAYFDGGHANGTGLTVSWQGTASASPSYGTGTDVVTSGAGGAVKYTGPPRASGQITLTTLTQAALVAGFNGAQTSVAVSINPSIPTTPTVALVIDSANGLMHLNLNAADGAASNKTVSFDIFRNGTRIVTGLQPNPTTRLATYDDTPQHATAATYVVRAYDSNGGYVDQSTGTVTGS